MTAVKPSPARLFSRAYFNRRLAAFLSALVLFPVRTFAFDAKRKTGILSNKDNLVEAILFYGQSNAGAGGDARSIFTTPIFPDRIVSFQTSRQIYGTQRVDPARLQGIGSLYDDPKSAPYPATAMAYALGHERHSNTVYFMHTVWYGGQPLTSFLRGSTSWSDLLSVAHRMRQVLSKRRLRGRVAALVLIQGESGPPGREIYAQVLHDFLDQILPDLEAQTDQDRSPVAILLQTNASNVQSATALGVALAQWDVARARSQDTVLAGPMYQFPLSDAVHQSAAGRMMLGDLLALVFEYCITRDQVFEPLHPVVARRVKDKVVISFKCPPDSLPLQWDHTWLTAVPNYGFQVKDLAGPVSIVSVQITGASEVTIRLPPDVLQHDLIVSYAMGQPPTKGWAPARGQLTAPSNRRSAFAGLDAGIPDTVTHYAIRFELPVR